MKYTISLLLLLLLCCSCSPSEGSKGEFDWLVGEWMRTDDAEGQQTFENWSRGNGSEYVGLGCTLQAGDTIFREELRLTQIDRQWNLEVIGVNESPTYFVFTEQSDSSFLCENPANEFPNQISYRRVGESLSASIFGGGQEIQFQFKKAL